jgi:hypothetical protein
MRDAGVAHFEQTEHGIKLAFWSAPPTLPEEAMPERGGLGPSPTVEETAQEPGDLPDAYAGGSVPYFDRRVEP